MTARKIIIEIKILFYFFIFQATNIDIVKSGKKKFLVGVTVLPAPLSVTDCKLHYYIKKL
jgi:hypothetical protein